ncbi:hypothetical protein BN903_21 [Halorubrum sp. AJ67]|nr:hypothetical protein BN903_21 [Halorubrum sp. AJ67]
MSQIAPGPLLTNAFSASTSESADQEVRTRGSIEDRPHSF